MEIWKYGKSRRQGRPPLLRSGRDRGPAEKTEREEKTTEKEGFLEKIAARGSLMRLLMLSTLGLGVVTGALFPFFVQAVLRLPGEVAFRPGFVLACLAAGFLVGFLNYVLVRFLLARVLKKLSFAAQRLARGDLA